MQRIIIKPIKGGLGMEYKNCLPSLDNYVAKYMDDEGCSFEEACEKLQLGKEEFINERKIEG